MCFYHKKSSKTDRMANIKPCKISTFPIHIFVSLEEHIKYVHVRGYQIQIDPFGNKNKGTISWGLQNTIFLWTMIHRGHDRKSIKVMITDMHATFVCSSVTLVIVTLGRLACFSSLAFTCLTFRPLTWNSRSVPKTVTYFSNLLSINYGAQNFALT